MTDSSSIDNDLVSLAPTAASILGIKSRLRFRLHGSSQKAHVVLRRVEPESDSEGEGETKGLAQFSLFAYKRIEVRPGKEILLTVADGPFKDRAIIFEGDELESSSLSDVEEETQITEDDDTSVPTDFSLPLKMRKPWAKRPEVPGILAPAPPPRTTRQSVGVQTDLADTAENAPTLLAAPPALDEDSQPASPPSAPGVSKSIPSTPISASVSSAPVSDIRVPNAAVPHAVQATQPKIAAVPPLRHRDHSPFPMEIDSTTDNSIPSSTSNLVPISPAPTKHDDVPAEISADTHTNGKLERWSPSVPVPAILHATVRPVDGTSESESSSSDTEDKDPLIPAPERPWSPSVPAALSTKTSRRHNIRTRRAEQLDNANGTSHTQPGLSTELLPQPSSPTSTTPLTPLSPSKTGLPTGPKSKVTNPFISGGVLTDFVGQPSSPPVSNEDHKIETLPEKISSSPSTVPRFARPNTLLPPPRPSVEVPPLPPSPAYPPSPGVRKNRSPSRLSPASSRGPFSHGPLESNFTSVPSHPSSPNLAMRRSQGTSWPPFRPLISLGDGSTEFDPPFRAGPDFSELPQPPPFRLTSGASTARGFTPPQAPMHGRPAVISSSNSIPVAPRHPFALPSAPGRSSSPAAQSLRNSQPLGSPTISPQPPRRPSHGMILDSGHPPRQPRSDTAMQAMASASLGQINPRSHNPYHRHQRHPHVPRPLADGRGRGIPMAAGAKRKASPPRIPSVLLEVPPKRPPPSTWPAALPIRCVAVQGERVAIQGIRFNRTGKLMAVTCTDFTIRVWDNVTYSEVALLPHSSSIVSAQWMDDDAGVLALCTDGALVRWTRPAGSTPPRSHDVWHWGRLVEPAVGVTPEDAPTALAYKGDRIAASFPKFGVRIWVMKQGSWQSQRPISRPNVTAIEFIDDGTALLGGTKDGVLWYCQLPDGVPRVYNFFKARICGIDVLPTGTHALVSQQVGRTHLVAISQDENRGKVKQVYTVQPDLQADAVYDANALFVGRNDAVLYGSANGYLFAWDKANANVLCGLDHGEGCVVQAIGTHRSSGSMRDGCVVTGSREGKLYWWGEPMESTVEEVHAGKRVKTS